MTEGYILAVLLWAGATFGISFMIGSIYHGAYPIRTSRFIIVYEDKIIVSTSGTMDGPGFVSIPRKEYYVEVIARDAEVYDLEKHKVYTLVFNKPVRGCMHIRLSPELYVSEEELRKLIEILKPKKVLLDGYYFPRIYAIFKMTCGDKYPELAEKLLKDFSEEIKKFGHHKVCAIMNALKSLCLAKRVDDAVRLAEAIIDGRAFNFTHLIDEKSCMRWFFESIFDENLTPACDLTGKYLEIQGYYGMGMVVAISYIALVLDLLGFKGITDILIILTNVSALLAPYVAGVWYGFLLDPVFWSRVSIKHGMKWEIFYMIFGTLIPFFISSIGLFLSREAMEYSWFFFIISVPAILLSIYIMLITCGYFQYRVGLKHAEILLRALEKSS